MSRVHLLVSIGLAAFLGACSSDEEVVGKAGSDPVDSGSGSESDDGGTADDGGSTGPGTGDDGTGDEGTGDEGTGDDGTGDDGTGDAGTGDEGTGDEGTGDDGGEGHEYDGIWSTTIEVTATLERSSGDQEGTCSGTADILLEHPSFRSILSCDFGEFGDSTFSDGEIDAVVEADDATLSGILKMGPLEMPLVGTIGDSALSATFSGEGSAGGRVLTMVGSLEGSQLSAPE
jgi:hypothetical protein